MNMQFIQKEPIIVIGISVRTNNADNRSIQDLGALWNHFFTNNIMQSISQRTCDDIFCIYTDYETDFTGDYTAIIGASVSNLDNIPDGMTGINIPADKYVLYSGKGVLPDIVVELWKKIWEEEDKLHRKYSSDIEVYSSSPADSGNNSVEIYISVK